MRRAPMLMLGALGTSIGLHALALTLIQRLPPVEAELRAERQTTTPLATFVEVEVARVGSSAMPLRLDDALVPESPSSPAPLAAPSATPRARKSRRARARARLPLPEPTAPISTAAPQDQESTPSPRVAAASIEPTDSDTLELEGALAPSMDVGPGSAVSIPASTSSSASSSTSSSSSGGIDAELLRTIAHRLDASATPCYPRSAQRQGREGVSTMRFCIDESGAPSNVALVHSSGIAQLDAAAHCVIDRAAPFPPLPKHCLTVPIRFALRHP
ncbi:MAG: TonB family protein [Myxococcales bacterium]|nr:TonB family protein [Myxococcales bacterium]